MSALGWKKTEICHVDFVCQLFLCSLISDHLKLDLMDLLFCLRH